MAMMNFNIKSEIDARNWLKEIERLNQETSDLIKEVGKALADVKQGCDADIVDDIAIYGNKILDSASSIFESMQQIANGVTSFIDKAKEALDAAKGLLRGAVNALGSNID